MKFKKLMIGLVCVFICVGGFLLYKVNRNQVSLQLEDVGVAEIAWENQLLTMELIVENKFPTDSSPKNGEGQFWHLDKIEDKIKVEPFNIFLDESTNKIHVIVTVYSLKEGEITVPLVYNENFKGNHYSQSYLLRIENDNNRIKSVSIENKEKRK